MKKSLLASTLILLLSASTCLAIGFSKAIVARSSPGTDSNSLKTWEDEWMMAEGDSVQIDINLSDVPEPLITGGLMIEYDPTQMSIVSANINEGSWDQGMSNIIYRDGGTIIITAGNLSTVSPDENGDISIANIQFECVDTCDGAITIKTIPGFDSVVGNSSGVYDDDIIPNYFDLVTTTTTTPIDLKPKQVWKSRWIPLPYLMVIESEEISKESFVNLEIYPQDFIFALPPIVWDEHYIWNIIWILPGMGDQTGRITLELDDEVIHDEFEINGNEPIEWQLPLLPGSFSSISPSGGEQGMVLTDVTITGKNTKFLDKMPVSISFSPAGLVLNSLSVISNTEIEFEVEISEDAPVGFRSVTVTYDDGSKSITGDNVFEVLEKTTTTTTTAICPTTCGDVFPPPSFPEAMDCGDGVVDENDVTELTDIIAGVREATDCQLMKADLPNGIPPNCGNPPNSQNCETDGDVDTDDLLVVIDLALGKANCYSYCEFGEIY